MKPAAAGGIGDGFATPPTSKWIGARTHFRATVGTPAETSLGSRFPGWAFPDSADGQANAMWDESELAALGWSTYKIDVLHENPNAGTGNVTLTLTASAVGSGTDDTTGDATLYGPTATAAGAQHIVTVTTLAASVSVTAGKLRHVRLLRSGNDAGDTLAGNWDVFGYRLTKVT